MRVPGVAWLASSFRAREELGAGDFQITLQSPAGKRSIPSGQGLELFTSVVWLQGSKRGPVLERTSQWHILRSPFKRKETRNENLF